MKKNCMLYLFGILIVLASRIEARAIPQEAAGVNIAGLQADLQTNLFSPNGPLAQLGNQIASSANELQKELANGAQAMQEDLKKTRDFLGSGTQDEIAGVNIGGLHAGIRTNIFSQTGPLAQVGNDLAEGERKLEDDLNNGANALGASLMDASNAFQAQLASGWKALIPPASADLSVGDLSQGASALKPGKSSKATVIKSRNLGQVPTYNQNDEATKTLQNFLNGGKSGGNSMTISSEPYGSNPPDLSDLFKSIKLPNALDNSNGIPEVLNQPNLLDQSIQNLKTLPELPPPDTSDPFKNFQLPNLFDNSQNILDLSPEKLFGQISEGLKSLSNLPTPDLTHLLKDVGVPNLFDNSQGIPDIFNPKDLLDQLAQGLKSLSQIPPPDIPDLFKTFGLPNLFDNAQGIPADFDPQLLLDQLAQGFKSLSQLAEGGELPFKLPNIDLTEALALPNLLKIPPLPLNGIVLDEALEALPAIAALAVI